ncbi:MAG TPA: transposase [Puia sp.]|nr:transposase [Puia sp.]
MTNRRKFTEEEKRAILAEANRRGTNVILRDYKLSYSVFSRWKEKFEPADKKGHASFYQLMQQLKEVSTENERLKKIIANQALELEIKTEKIRELTLKFRPSS